MFKQENSHPKLNKNARTGALEGGKGYFAHNRQHRDEPVGPLALMDSYVVARRSTRLPDRFRESRRAFFQRPERRRSESERKRVPGGAIERSSNLGTDPHAMPGISDALQTRPTQEPRAPLAAPAEGDENRCAYGRACVRRKEGKLQCPDERGVARRS